MAEKRITMNLDVPADVQHELRSYCKTRGRIQRDLVAQVLTWFMAQPGPVKRVVLNDVDEDLEIAYAEVLEELASRLRGPGRGKVGRGFRIDSRNEVKQVRD